MYVVVDCNRVIAAFLKDGTTRQILFDREHLFVAPEFLKEEVNKYKSMILVKAHISTNDFDTLQELFFERMSFIKQTLIESYMDKARNCVSDEKDTAYVACCFASKAEGVWTHDPHFSKNKEFKIITNIGLLKKDTMNDSKRKPRN